MACRCLGVLVVVALVVGCTDPGPPPDLTLTALHELRAGKYDDAIASASAAIKEHPENSEAYLYRGRAFHYRNSRRDPQNAIADFDEAIRLAPNSSDAYYSRALVYRDLRQVDLADADDERARQLDGSLKEVYQQLPDTMPELTKGIINDKQIQKDLKEQAETSKAQTEKQRKELYEQLKNQYEPGFGELRSPKKGKPSSPGESTSETTSRDYLDPASYGLPSAAPSNNGVPIRDPAAQANPWAFGSDSAARGTTRSLPPQANQQDTGTAPGNGVPGSSDYSGGMPSSGIPSSGMPYRQAIPSLSSPFAQRPPAGPANPAGMAPPNTGLQSPFGRSTPGATGYVQPTSPFGAQPGQAASPPPRNTRSNSNLYSNPAVRPLNPRDYSP